MADESVTATARNGKGNPDAAYLGVLAVYDITRFLGEALAHREDDAKFSLGAVAGLARIMDHCGDLLGPALEDLSTNPVEASHG
jgi:hypothetical protein